MWAISLCNNAYALKTKNREGDKVTLVCDRRSHLGRAADIGTGIPALFWLNRIRWKIEERRKVRFERDAFTPMTFTIGVGNIAFGGSGKTPVTILLGKTLIESGRSVAAVVKHMPQRKYVKSDSRRAEFDSNKIGDEALLIELEYAKSVEKSGIPGKYKVIAAKNKVEAVRRLDRENYDAIIVDDALALTGLKPHVNLALVAPADFGLCDQPAPLLREPPGMLKKATHVAISMTDEKNCCGIETENRIDLLLERVGAPHVCAKLENRLVSLNPLTEIVWRVRGHLEEPISINPDSRPILPAFNLCGKRVLTVASIARPERFEQAVLDAGVDHMYVMRFADHYRLKSRDVFQVFRRAKMLDVDFVITTMKDSMRIGLKSKPLSKLAPAESEWLIRRCYVAEFAISANPADAFEDLIHGGM